MAVKIQQESCFWPSLTLHDGFWRSHGIGFAIRYIPTSIRQVEGEDSATLVRGADRFRHFELEPRPKIDMDPEMLELHRQIAERNAKILYRGTGVTSFNDPAAIRG